MPKKEYTLKEKIIRTIYLIWFLGSMIALVIVFQKNLWLSLAVFGQVFFIFGIITLIDGIKKKNYKPVFFLFIVVGILALLYGIVMVYGRQVQKEVLKSIAPYIFISIFFFAGVLIIANFFVRKVIEKNCTELVKGICVDITSDLGSSDPNDMSGAMYCPVFSYTYNGKEYEVCSGFFSSQVETKIGQKYDIYINPKYPYHFREQGETRRQNGSEIVLGIFFILVSLVALGLIISL